MAKWIKVVADYDHRWPSGAVTALIDGQIINVKDEVADAAIEAGAAKVSDKPKEGHVNPLVAPALPYGKVRVVKTGGFPGYPDPRYGPLSASHDPTGVVAPATLEAPVAVPVKA